MPSQSFERQQCICTESILTTKQLHQHLNLKKMIDNPLIVITYIQCYCKNYKKHKGNHIVHMNIHHLCIFFKKLVY